MKTPCSNRIDLFEPYRRPNESMDMRGYRIDKALKVCKLCPLEAKEKCFRTGLKNKYTRGVWGGIIRTSLTTAEDIHT